MMFRRISYQLALQFTAFVFLLLMITGLLFLAADLGNARRQLQDRMEQSSNTLMQMTLIGPNGELPPIPAHLRERVRIVNPLGQVLYGGWLFAEVPVVPQKNPIRVNIDGDDYRILTRPIVAKSELIGYMQLAEIERVQFSDLSVRALLFLLMSSAISALTFFVGLFFARSSLRPAQQAMERLEQFTQDASHELRTPIAIVNSTLDLALKTGEFPRRITSAKNDLKHMSLLVERLLELAQLDRFLLEKKEVDLSSLIRESAESFGALAQEKGITIKENIKPGITVQGDESLIRQIADNLLSNAVKFSGDKGAVTIDLTDKTLSVKDKGDGIPEESLPRIFDRFYQADESRSHGGFGLGLSLVKRIVDLHGWNIDVKSKQGKGTEFTIKFT
jgi:signal transduction histidine kinase